MIHGLSDINKNKEEKKKKTTDFYAGGQSSGLNLLFLCFYL